MHRWWIGQKTSLSEEEIKACQSLLRTKFRAQGVCIVALVGEQRGTLGQIPDQVDCGSDVALLACRQR